MDHVRFKTLIVTMSMENDPLLMREINPECFY